MEVGRIPFWTICYRPFHDRIMNKTEYQPILYYKFSERLAVAAANYFNKLDLVLGTKIYELDKLVLKAPLWFRKNFEKSSYKTDGIPLEVLLKFKSRNDLVKKPMENHITKHLLDADKKEFSDIKPGSFLDKQEITITVSKKVRN